MSLPINTWYVIEFDTAQVHLNVSPPGQQPWTQTFRWDDVERVCFEAGDFLVSDTIYLFTRLRPESFVIPIEASGGQQFWFEIIERGLFDAELAIQAAAATEGVFCWPSAN